MGVRCKEGQKFVFEIGKQLIDKNGNKKAKKNYRIIKLSMTIERGNVASVFGSVPSCEAIKGTFYSIYNC